MSAVVLRKYLKDSGGDLVAVRCDYNTKVDPYYYQRIASNGKPSFQKPKGNYFVQWDCYFDEENNEIRGSGYADYWFNTMKEVEEHFSSRS